MSESIEMQCQHQSFIEDKLPGWLKTAQPGQRNAYMAALHQLAAASRGTAQTLSRLIAPADFARPLLIDALRTEYGLTIDVDAIHLVMIRLQQDWTSSRFIPRTLSLLEAALRNFDTREVEGISAERGWVILPKGAYRLARQPGSEAETDQVYVYEKGQVVPITPRAFMETCRALNLGQRYLTHLEAVLKPWHPDQPRLAPNQPQAEQFMALLAATLNTQALEAYLEGHLSASALETVRALCEQSPTQVLWEGVKVKCQWTEMLYTGLKRGYPLHGAFVIEGPQGRCVAYLPGAPEHPFKEYASLAGFQAALRERLRAEDYQHYFQRLILQRVAPRFFHRLAATLSPRPLGLGGLGEPKADPDADLGYKAFGFETKLPMFLYLHFIVKTMDDARVLCVPTEDRNAQQARDESAEKLDTALEILNLAALFVPGLGEVMGGSVPCHWRQTCS